MPNSITFFCEKFYNSPSVLDMPFKIRSLYKYTILNPSRSCSGVYTLPINKICFETGLTRKEVESGLKELESKFKKLFYEFDTQQIFIFTVFKLMPKSKQIIVSAQNDFKFNIVTARTLKKFQTLYPGYLDGHQTVTRPSITDTVTDTVTDTEEEEKSHPPSFSSLQKKFLEIVKTYPEEFKLKQQEDAQWLKDRIENTPGFTDLDFAEEIDGWGTWLEAEHRKKEANQANRFPISDFKQSLTNRFKKALKFKKEKNTIKKPVSGTASCQPEKEPEPLKSKNPEAELIWSFALGEIEKKVPQESFDTWFMPTIGYDLEENKLEVGVPNQLFANWLKEHYAEIIKEAVGDREVEFVVVPAPW